MRFNSVLHVGAGKCGSTTLQSSLSHSPLLSDTDNNLHYEYVVIKDDGNVFRAEQLGNQDTSAGYGSVDLTHERHERVDLSKLIAGIQKIHADNKIPILSCEGWLSRAHQFESRGLLTQLSITPKVVIYVRPPLEWINSAWWQWGAWLNMDFDEWLERQIKVVNWTRWIREWKNLDGVASVEVRLATSDVVESFGDLLNVNLPKHHNVNLGSPPVLLRFLQKHRQYRTGPHDNAVERYLLTKLPITNEKPPWILADHLQVNIVEGLKDSYNELLAFLPPDEQHKMRDDNRWWHGSTRETRVAEPPESILSQRTPIEMKLSFWANVFRLKRSLKTKSPLG